MSATRPLIGQTRDVTNTFILTLWKTCDLLSVAVWEFSHNFVRLWQFADGLSRIFSSQFEKRREELWVANLSHPRLIILSVRMKSRTNEPQRLTQAELASSPGSLSSEILDLDIIPWLKIVPSLSLHLSGGSFHLSEMLQMVSCASLIATSLMRPHQRSLESPHIATGGQHSELESVTCAPSNWPWLPAPQSSY